MHTPFFVGNRKSDDTDNNQQPSNGNGMETTNGNGGNGQTGNGQTGNGQQSGGESYLAADVRKMPGGGYGVYADVFKKGKRVMTPGGKHRERTKESLQKRKRCK